MRHNYRVGKDLTHSFPMHPFSTLWKHQKVLRFSDVFRGYRKGALGTNGLINEWPLLSSITQNSYADCTVFVLFILEILD